MDITLERILSLIPKKPDGKFVHGAKKEFCDKIGAPSNIVNEWERGTNRSYRNYLYQIASEYGVTVEWLKGETDETKKDPSSMNEGEVDDELAGYLQELKDDPSLRFLLDSARGNSKEKVMAAAQMLAWYKDGGK